MNRVNKTIEQQGCLGIPKMFQTKNTQDLEPLVLSYILSVVFTVILLLYGIDIQQFVRYVKSEPSFFHVSKTDGYQSNLLISFPYNSTFFYFGSLQRVFFKSSSLSPTVSSFSPILSFLFQVFSSFSH